MAWALRAVAALTVLIAGSAAHAGAADLLAGYLQVRERLAAGPPGIPIHVKASARGDVRSATVYGLVGQPFTALRAALSQPDDWCAFLPLNQNVKACAWRSADDGAAVSLYVGRKHYQPPEAAMRVDGALRVVESAGDYVRVALHAEQGPLGSADYRIVIEAAPRPEGTLVRLRWSYRTSWRSRMATEAYLATVGRDKVGFTVVGRDPSGRPHFVSGVEGVIERNAVRYYLALEAFLDTARLPPPERLGASLRTWYAYTERHPRQLRELSRRDYLHAKELEFRNQARLQRSLDGDRAPLAQVDPGRF